MIFHEGQRVFAGVGWPDSIFKSMAKQYGRIHLPVGG